MESPIVCVPTALSFYIKVVDFFITILLMELNTLFLFTKISFKLSILQLQVLCMVV